MTDEDMNLNVQARKIFLFKEGIPWVKNEGNEGSDISIGCFIGAEVCELFVSCIFQQLSQFFEHQSVGLYRDDGRAILKNLTI